MTNTLHILNLSPFTNKQLSNCVLFVATNDSILLTGDAVYALQPQTLPYQTLIQCPAKKIFALSEDLKARSLTITDSERIHPIDYEAFVKLCASHKRTLSWA